jgi:hypothetical protein
LIKLLKESYEMLLMERLVIGLSHVWRAHMVYVGGSLSRDKVT